MDERLSKILYENDESGFAYNPVSVPIYETSIFHYENCEQFAKAMENEFIAHIYSRGNNPTVEVLEKKIAQMDFGERAKAFSSGVAAISASTMAFLKSGDHVVCVRDCYNWASNHFGNYLQRFGVEVTFIEGTETGQFENATRDNTRIYYLESPTSMTFKLQDIEKVSSIARKHGIKTIIDNSWATPYFQNPIKLGADLVVYSASKYIGGHSDIIGGIVVGNMQDMNHIFNTEVMNIGAVPGPFEGWLMLRGLRTLPVRLDRHMKNALEIVEFLLDHPAIENVYYPYHKSHPQFELAKKQLKGGSGLFSFNIKTKDPLKVREFADGLKPFRKAVSWGGYESQILPKALWLDTPTPGLVRVHIGLEDPEYLIGYLEKGLKIFL